MHVLSLPPVAAITSFESNVLARICDVLGDTDTGPTGTEIERLLKKSPGRRPLQEITKRHRVYEALRLRQERAGAET